MTEIPEHLLKRSRDRKSGDSASSGESAGASGENVPAVQKAAAQSNTNPMDLISNLLGGTPGRGTVGQ